MKKKINQMIKQFIAYYSSHHSSIGWREPIIRYVKAREEKFSKLKKQVSSNHVLPTDIIKQAKTIITYFIPFEKSIVKSNIKGQYSSREWALAYVETNQLISDLNQYLKSELAKLNYQVAVIPATHNFDKEKLISDWSHRHVAQMAGLGKFGLNNMLITEKGCCGRLGSVVSDIEIKIKVKAEKEFCLEFAGEECKACINRCVNGALTENSFDREKCYQLLLKNDKLHSDLSLTDVCGKCCVDLPCSLENPVAKI